MLSEDKIKRKFSTITTEIKSSFDNFRTDITNKIVNEQESWNLYYELETAVKKCLVKVFGPEEDIASNALSSEFLSYDSLTNRYSDAVIFNYWSYKGESIETPIKSETTGRWRDNLYYKGQRWSDKEKKKLFYEFFDEIKSALQGEAPVDFFTKHGVECDTRYLKIIGLSDIDEIGNSYKFKQLAIPDLSRANGVIDSKCFRELLDLITKMKKFNQNREQLNKFRSENKDKIDTLSTLASDAFSEAKKKDKALLTAVKEGFIKGLTEDTKKNKKLMTAVPLRDIFNVVIAYQYYDHPYDIHMFLPTANHEKLYSCLVISAEEGSEKINPYIDSIAELANALGQIKAIEQEIWKNMKLNLPIYWRWKKLYEKYSDQYQRLSNVAMNICLAICRKEELEVFSIPARIKEFDSFYNKIVSRANGRDKDYPEKPDDIPDAEWPAIRATRLEDYRAKILNPTIENAKLIFEELKDVLGLRIICLFLPDREKIMARFKYFESKKEIESVDLKENSGLPGYRSMHITFALGNEKCKIYGLEDMQGRKCEVQIRTILDQGWADVSHKIAYKPEFPQLLTEKIRSAIERELENQQSILGGVDQTFERIVQRAKEISERANL